MAPLKAREGDCVMGFLNKKPVIKQEVFQPLELNEANVQAIFNRCLAADGASVLSEDTTASSLYFSSLGWEKEDDGLRFVTSQLQANQKNIQYLVGQLKPVHEGQHILTLEDMAKNYQGSVWARERASLMQLLYLGSSDALAIFSPLIAKWNGTTLNMSIKPTLSPKDPAFPAWWEEHKAEWED